MDVSTAVLFQNVTVILINASLACTASDGTLSFAEIQDVLANSTGVSVNTPVYDKAAQVKYVVYDDVRTCPQGFLCVLTFF